MKNVGNKLKQDAHNSPGAVGLEPDWCPLGFPSISELDGVLSGIWSFGVSAELS